MGVLTGQRQERAVLGGAVLLCDVRVLIPGTASETADVCCRSATLGAGVVRTKSDDVSGRASNFDDRCPLSY